MVEYYMADPRLNWNNTSRIGQVPDNPMGLGTADLFAGFLLKLYHAYGGQACLSSACGTKLAGVLLRVLCRKQLITLSFPLLLQRVKI